MPKNILVVDDSVTMRKVMEIIFAHEDVRLLLAGNGQEALSLVQQVKPDAMLVDQVLPGMAGYDLAAHLRQDPALGAAPMFLLGCTSEPFDENRARASGVTAWLQKPLDSSTVLEKVLGSMGMTPVTVPSRAGAAARPAAPAAAAPGAAPSATPPPAPAAQPPRPPSLGVPPSTGLPPSLGVPPSALPSMGVPPSGAR
ncbi:MAG: response regulator, partial [Deltaproteobacteria bacterium]|nr:response regulator [Deltaproteobacteria bacterium]